MCCWLAALGEDRSQLWRLCEETLYGVFSGFGSVASIAQKLTSKISHEPASGGVTKLAVASSGV